MLLLILVPMLLSMLLIAVFRGRIRSDIIAISMAFVSLLLSVYFIIFGAGITESFNWFSAGGYSFALSIAGSGIGLSMAVFVSLLSFLVFIFSRFYMKKEKQERYYFELSLFVFSMLGLVISSSLLLFYIFWELISVSSYLLIGFYNQEEKSSAAARKAIILTRIGDYSLLAAIIILFAVFKTFSIPIILAGVSSLSYPLLIIVASLVLIAALAKSAQFPFYVWLPDAMEAPTTVTALLHSATMIASGAFLVIVLSKLILATPVVDVVLIVSFFTVFLSIFLALKEGDSKRIMAYSTIESMGFVFLAVATGNPAGGLFYLFAHGVFKAAALLLIGELIAWFGTRSIYRLKKIGARNNTTFIPMLLAMLSLSAIPPLIGFFGHAALTYDFNIYEQALFIAISFFTALLAFRFLFITYGNKMKRKIARTMSQIIPIYTLLAIMIVGGISLFFIQGLMPTPYAFDPFLLVSTVAALLGIYAAYRLFFVGDFDIGHLLDGIRYDKSLESVGSYIYSFSLFLSGFDSKLSDAYGLLGFGSTNLSYFVRKFQNGDVEFYIDILLLGLVLLLAMLAVIMI